MKKYLAILAFGFVLISAPSFAKACHCGDVIQGGTRENLTQCAVGYSGLYIDTCTREPITNNGIWITSNTCTINNYDLEVKKDGTGSGNVTGGGKYNHGTIVTATATPAEGSTFTGWSSNCPGGVITLVENSTCIATFTLIPVEVIDVCDNIDEIQESVPEGMVVSDDKQCTTPTPTRRRSSGSIPLIIASNVPAEKLDPIPAIVGEVLGAETDTPEVIVPKLPKTGFPDQQIRPWYIEILSAFLKLIK